MHVDTIESESLGVGEEVAIGRFRRLTARRERRGQFEDQEFIHTNCSNLEIAAEEYGMTQIEKNRFEVRLPMYVKDIHL